MAFRHPLSTPLTSPCIFFTFPSPLSFSCAHFVRVYVKTEVGALEERKNILKASQHVAQRDRSRKYKNIRIQSTLENTRRRRGREWKTKIYIIFQVFVSTKNELDCTLAGSSTVCVCVCSIGKRAFLTTTTAAGE